MRRRGNSYSFISEVVMQANTFIGGVATQFPTKAALASSLAISEDNISLFAVTGNNIEANIGVSYAIPGNLFNKKALDYYLDIEGKITSVGATSFYTNGTVKNTKSYNFKNVLSVETGGFSGDAGGANAIKSIRLENATSIGGQCFSGLGGPSNRIYIPRATTLGLDTLDNIVFRNCYRSKLYLNPFLQTSKAGAEEGDVAYFRSQMIPMNLGASITYILNFTKPSSITDLSYNSGGGTLNFTPPASTNTLDFYEVYVNGFYKQEITGSGATVSGLISGDKVTVYACDIYYNRSISNEITI